MKKFCQVVQNIYFYKSGQKILWQISGKTFNNFFLNTEIFFAQCLCNKKPPINIHCRSLNAVNNRLTYSKSISSSNNQKNKQSSIIYYGSLTGSVKGIKVFTCISSLGGLVLQPFLLQHLLNKENLAISLFFFSTIGFFTFVTPFLIHLFTRKYVTEIKYISETDTYSATTFSFFLRKINMDFKVEDVSATGALSIFSTMTIKGRHVFIVSECFLDISHYARLMGYDKPLDLKLDSSVDTNEKKFIEENKDNLNTKKV